MHPLLCNSLAADKTKLVWSADKYERLKQIFLVNMLNIFPFYAMFSLWSKKSNINHVYLKNPEFERV